MSLPFIFNPVSDTLVVVGGASSGKSTLVKEVLKTVPSYVVYDVERQYELPRGQTLEEVTLLLSKKNYKVAYSPILKDFDDLDNFCKIIYYRASGFTFVLEESGSFDIAKQRKNNYVKALVDSGRHRKLSTIFIARRAKDIPPSAIAGATKIVSFAQRRPEDIAYINSYLNCEGIEKVNAKERYSYLYFDVKNDKLFIQEPLKLIKV